MPLPTALIAVSLWEEAEVTSLILLAVVTWGCVDLDSLKERLALQQGWQGLGLRRGAYSRGPVSSLPYLTTERILIYTPHWVQHTLRFVVSCFSGSKFHLS